MLLLTVAACALLTWALREQAVPPESVSLWTVQPQGYASTGVRDQPSYVLRIRGADGAVLGARFAFHPHEAFYLARSGEPLVAEVQDANGIATDVFATLTPGDAPLHEGHPPFRVREERVVLDGDAEPLRERLESPEFRALASDAFGKRPRDVHVAVHAGSRRALAEVFLTWPSGGGRLLLDVRPDGVRVLPVDSGDRRGLREAGIPVWQVLGPDRRVELERRLEELLGGREARTV